MGRQFNHERPPADRHICKPSSATSSQFADQWNEAFGLQIVFDVAGVAFADLAAVGADTGTTKDLDFKPLAPPPLGEDPIDQLLHREIAVA